MELMPWSSPSADEADDAPSDADEAASAEVFDFAGSDSPDETPAPPEAAEPAAEAPAAAPVAATIAARAATAGNGAPIGAPIAANGGSAAVIGAPNAAPIAAAEESDGFEEVKAPSRRKRRRGPAVDVAALKPQPTECSICYDPCAISGRHRLAALKCGHLFGKKCIDRWVAERKTCPNCNMVVRRADIRVLFSDHVAVVDNSGIEAMTQKWEDERSKRIQVETELSRAKLQLQILTTECNRHQAEAKKAKHALERLQKQIASMNPASTQTLGSSTPTLQSSVISPIQPSASQPNPLSPVDELAKPKVIALTQPAVSSTLASPSARPRSTAHSPSLSSPPSRPQPQPSNRAALFPSLMRDSPSQRTESSQALFDSPSRQQQQGHFTQVYRFPLTSSRVLAIVPSGSKLCVGESISSISHGILKMSAVDPRHTVRIAAHQAPVRDIAISARGDLALTVAFDGKLAVSNLNSDSVVLQIPLPPARRQGWSCALSATDPFAMYCGFHDGVVAKYDMRRPAGGDHGVISTFQLRQQQPVHSIKLFESSGSRGVGSEGIVAATFSGISVWASTGNSIGTGFVDSMPSIPHSLDAYANIPSCCSLSAVGTRAIVSNRGQSASHSLFDVGLEHGLGSRELSPVGAPLQGHRTPSVLTRSSAWRDPASGSIRVACGDMASQQLMVWDVSTGQVAEQLAPPTTPRGPRPTGLEDAQQMIVDVQHSAGAGRELLGVLRPNEIALFRSS